MSQVFFCRFCNCESPTNGTTCFGCGSDFKKASGSPKKKRLTCPKCNSTQHSSPEQDRFVCAGCSSVFEQADFTFYDDRPLHAAMKAERMESARKGGRRYTRRKPKQ